ncbi:hypothetical protein HPB48_000052 [Haemaphysalis longicornis]|uniref:Argonaute n=1 Tax=Haemaphysalis longicornis TaxID=44386 RepID=A0A9J6FXD1_HAELO|nr:hypothetical protein HPB48_000052 [Haemaphysalis longicornis]
MQQLDMRSIAAAVPTPHQLESAPERSRPLRGGPGPTAATIRLLANHYPIRVLEGTVYHYDVTVSSQRRSQAPAGGAAPGNDWEWVPSLIARINRQVIAKFHSSCEQIFNIRPVFDGRKNLYTRTNKLGAVNNFTVSVQVDGGRERQYNVAVKLVAELNLKTLNDLYIDGTLAVPQGAIQALDVIMRHGPCLNHTPVGRSLFADLANEDRVSLDAVVELRAGYYASVRPAQQKLMLNVDRSAMVFYKSGSVVERMKELLKKRGDPSDLARLSDEQLAVLSSALRSVRVKGTHCPRQYKVAEVTRLPACEITFTRTLTDRQTEVLSVASYFREKYPGTMQDENLPCIRAGSSKRPVYLPIDVCEIVEGQPYRKTLSPTMTADIIKATAKSPRERFGAIQASVNDLVDHADPYLQEFGIAIDTQAAVLTGRRLNDPMLAFGVDQVRPFRGQWQLPESGGLLHAKPIQDWALLKCGCPQWVDTAHLVNTLREIGGSLGMTVYDPLVQDRRCAATLPVIIETLAQLRTQYRNLRLVIVVLGDRAKACYAHVKHTADVRLGILTQCVMEKNLTKIKSDSNFAALVTNLCLKINAKLGGINNGFCGDQEQPFSDTLVIGADVTHPAPGNKEKPSIAACVGSLDDVPSQYRASIRVQRQENEAVARVEIITNLKDMVAELLRAYREKRRKRPERIFFYRDGVSEGQFSSVLRDELSAIQKACSDVISSIPPISFIVVQKRHRTRFKPVREADGVGKMGNIPPGTVVDSVVTHPREKGFFLCSHFGIQGTSRPARYVVLHDESHLELDTWQKLSYQLCHTYARCPRSVSIPTPVYYAHLAAFRAKEHIASACWSRGGASIHGYNEAVKVAEALKNVMYFV